RTSKSTGDGRSRPQTAAHDQHKHQRTLTHQYPDQAIQDGSLSVIQYRWVKQLPLRHTFGQDLHDAGVPLDTIQKLMGHDKIASTQVYSKPTMADQWVGLKHLEQARSARITGDGNVVLLPIPTTLADHPSHDGLRQLRREGQRRTARTCLPVRERMPELLLLPCHRERSAGPASDPPPKSTAARTTAGTPHAPRPTRERIGGQSTARSRTP
ncbi:site-specific integrase, partial [Catenulispora sp. NL8]|nr:site-specific integrase [Catenulispora pinistramenti]